MNKLYDETDIQRTAQAIRDRGGDDTLYKVEDFADAINAIPRPSGSRTVTQNGTFDVSDKEFVNVSVEGGGSAPVIEALSVTENGTYTAPAGVDGYSPVVVSVPSDVPSLVELNVTTNGDYYPGAGVDGFDEVHVNVAPNLTSITFTTNGTYTPTGGLDGFDSVTVNVPVTPAPSGTISITENGIVNVSAYQFANVNVSGGGGTIVEGNVTFEESTSTYELSIPQGMTSNFIFVIFHKGTVGYQYIGRIMADLSVNDNRVVGVAYANWVGNRMSNATNSMTLTLDKANNKLSMTSVGASNERPFGATTYYYYFIPMVNISGFAMTPPTDEVN